MLLAVALTLGGVSASSPHAVEEGWRGGVLVILMAVTLLLCRPPSLVVLARGDGAALPGARVGLLMFAAILSIRIQKIRFEYELTSSRSSA